MMDNVAFSVGPISLLLGNNSIIQHFFEFVKPIENDDTNKKSETRTLLRQWRAVNRLVYSLDYDVQSGRFLSV